MKSLVKKCASKILIKVKKGPLRHYKIIAASGMKFIRGNYEMDTVDFFQKNVKEGFNCYDIGGHVGYMSLILAKLSGITGRVIVFEPRPINISYIERHVSVNKIKNIELFRIGISNSEGEASFDIDRGSGTGRISEKGMLSIKVDSLDNLFQKGKIVPPDFIKMDIEGEEMKALAGAETVLKKYKPIIHLSTHGTEIHNSCIDYINQLGYTRIEEMNGGFTALP